MTTPPPKTEQRTLSLYRSVSAPCPYLPNMEAQNDFTLFDRTDKALLTALINQGFRRSDDILYRPACKECSACTPCRINIDKCNLNKKSTKRILSKNRHLTRTILGTYPDDALTRDLYRLFQHYQETRHKNGGMDNIDFEGFKNFASTSDTTELWLYRDNENTLQGVIILDSVHDGYSAMYSFYNPDYDKNSLGKHMIYDVVKQLKISPRQHLYLGYWIENSPKMAYKINFDGVEVFHNSAWNTPKEK